MVSLGQSKMGGVYYDPTTGKKKKEQKPPEPQKWAIGSKQFATSAEYEKAKRTPAVALGTLREPEQIAKIEAPYAPTPEQQQILQQQAQQQAIMQQQQIQQIQQELGIEPLKSELEQKIIEKPSLEPEQTMLERGAGVGLAPAVAIGNLIGKGLEAAGIVEQFTPQTAKELTETKTGKALGAATLGTGVALAGAVVAPYAAALAARTSVGAVMGIKFSTLAKVTASLGILAAGGAAFDWNGWEMNTQRKIIGGYVEDGEKLIAIDRASGDHEFVMNILIQAAAEIDEAERVLKTGGNNNIQNRVGKEYLDDMNNIRTARIAIFRRINELELIARTGQAALKPDELMYAAAQFEGE